MNPPTAPMRVGIILLNFGEPAVADEDRVTHYLEHIFRANNPIENHRHTEVDKRAQTLAARRAPGLVREYNAIGGSPLNQQSRRQAAALEDELQARGFDDVTTYVGMQYTEPFIEDAAAQAIDDEVDTLIGLSGYPLCGPSTTIAAVRTLSDSIEGTEWDGTAVNLTGWHRHPQYLRLRADAIRTFAARRGVELSDRDTELVFAAHGTPQHYLDEGSRYIAYVTEWCDLIAQILGIESYTIGYQNHESRGVPWTEPAIEDVIRDIDVDRVVVDPVSFMHEQSETLWDLDVEVRDVASDAGIEFYRVPIPHDDERFPVVLAELVEPTISGFDPRIYHLRSCACAAGLNALCLNETGDG